MNRSPRILLIRRDNIGDLICTTPLLHAIRRQFPGAYLAVLVSSYNGAVLDGNPDVDDVFVFLKRQQKSHGHGLLSVLWQRWRLVRALRKNKFDYIVLANGGWRYAKQLGGKVLVGFRERDNPDSKQPNVIVPLVNAGKGDHEVVKMARLGAAIGVPESVARERLWLFPDSDRARRVRNTLLERGWGADTPGIAVHISSRKAVQRWPEGSFVQLIQALIQHYRCQIVLLWSPGAENDAMHPGDDEKAARIMAALSDLPVFPCVTACIEDLVATLSLADQMVCSDGGAMHVAAALGKPILCFFGHTGREDWHPWAVPYVLIQPETRVVQDISVDEALAGFARLQSTLDDAVRLDARR